ncbi:MAG: ybaO [Gammaproteobacteria bacterium]|jgi:Lrp/AsnC family leucine-responsive transcriptional regulator|nr:ybaO [Gammaproteobacteria bacterium]
MDRIDKQILTLLQENAGISNQELADKVALSPSPCLRRVKQLEETGIIQKQVALLSAEKLGLQLTVLVLVGIADHSTESMALFEKSIQKLSEVNQCYLITGQSADYLLKVIVPDLNAYQTFLLKKLTCIKGVNTVQSSFVLHPVVDKTALPLDHL